MKAVKKLRSNLVFIIVSSIVVVLLLFSTIVSLIGFFIFSDTIKSVYANTTYHMALTATTLVNGNNIDTYLASGGTSVDYKQSENYLDKYCDRMGLTLIYIIKVDTSDYGSFTSVFNSVAKDAPYTKWEIGYQRDTTNQEYADTYKALYSGEIEYGTIYRTNNLNGAPPHITTLVPVKNSDGKVVSLLCVQRPMQELIDSIQPYLTNVIVIAVVLIVLLSVLSMIYIKRQVVKPLRRITAEAQRFASENKSGEKMGADISRIYEISGLADAIDKMEEDMLVYIDDLTTATTEKERIGTELALAGKIQENSVPNTFPPFPERKEIDIFASMSTAKEVGGDFYDYFFVDDDHLAILIADVSGKGIPAALFMMVTNILINDMTRMGGTPSQILEFVNERICEHNKAEMFVTVWLGILEISTGKLTYANAGHECPALMTDDGEFKLIKSKHGFVIGGLEGTKYKDQEMTLKPGDKLFLYTDGVPEATDSDENMYGLDRMIDALNSARVKDPEGIISAVRDSVDDFVGDADQFDDLTVLCVNYNGPDPDNSRTLVTDAEVDSLPEVMSFIDGFLESVDCSMKAQMAFDLSVEELFVNIAHYAYPDSDGQAEISICKNGDVVSVTLKDRGIPYDPLKKPDPDITLSVKDRQIGGLGIFLVKKNMDSVEYKYEDGHNILTIIKRI